LGVRWEVVIAGIKWDRPGAEDANNERKHKEGENKKCSILFLASSFRMAVKKFFLPFLAINTNSSFS
jgi:hypothetical protein